MSKTPSPIANRIVAHADVAPDQLLAHPQNYRRHPGRQLDMLRGSLQEVGWVREVLVNRRTGHVVDGHARCEEAMRQGLPSVPVSYIDVSEEEELLLLAVLDPMSELAVHDDVALKELLNDVNTSDAALQDLIDSVQTMARPAAAIMAEPMDFGPVSDEFWLNVRGPLPRQMDVLEALRKALEELPGVTVEIGTVAER